MNFAVLLGLAIPGCLAVLAAWHVATTWCRMWFSADDRRLAAQDADRISLAEAKLAHFRTVTEREIGMIKADVADVKRTAGDIAAAVNYRRRS